MPELTLAEWDELWTLHSNLALAQAEAGGFVATNKAGWVAAIRLKAAKDAYEQRLLKHGPALLALAREALERRERVADEGAKLRELMQDPRYWHDRDPEIVARVVAGWRKIYPESPDA